MKTLDVSHLPPYDISSQSPIWWGQLCIDLIEGSMFCILIGAFLYTRLRIDVWPPPGDQFPHLLLPTLALDSAHPERAVRILGKRGRQSK